MQYVKYYAGVGIPVTHLGFLNEPDYVCVVSNPVVVCGNGKKADG